MSAPKSNSAIFLMGPTAAGKSALAMALHERFPIDIISVDASQVYRGMDIGTAKPTAAEQACVPHRLIDIRDPAEPYSAAQFRVDALREMSAITEDGRIPLLVGGTMFYFHALEHGIAPLPSANAQIREQLSREAQDLGWPGLHRRLQGIDPAVAARIEPHDAQRIQRALEIVTLTGKSPSNCYVGADKQAFPYEVIKIGIVPRERARLHARIEARFHHMLASGFVAEVQCLRARGDLSLELPSMRTVGYRQIWQYLTGLANYNEMIKRGVVATRQLAKRQLTWLRSYEGVHHVDSDATDLHSVCAGYLASKLGRKGL